MNAAAENATPKTPDARAFGGFWEAVDKIDFINAEIGKQRALDMEVAYLEMLELFCDKLPQERETLESYLRENDLPNFAILVHGMKSSLITIGALNLSETALALEKASKGGNRQFCEDTLPQFSESLLELYTQLTEILNVYGNTQGQNLPTGDRVYLCENAKTALNAALSYDRDAGIEAVEKLLKYDYGAETNRFLKDTRAALKCFSFDEAVKLLRKMLKI